MKTILCTIISVLLLRTCQLSPENTLAKETDSKELYPPTLASLDQREYRYYHRAIKKFFDSLLITKGFNGGILVAKNGTVIYEKYAGYQDLRKKDSLTAHSPLHIASTSKTFTGLAVLKLVQDGKLGLNDPLETFFPGFPYEGITVKLLLNHRSGLPNYGYYLSDKKIWDPAVSVRNEDVLNSLYTHKPGAASRPDTRFNYCNTNFVLLAMIIEKVSGMSYSEFLNQNFFQPLQMNDTYVYSPADSARAIPSFKANAGFWQNDQFDLTYGDKNIYSTPKDLLRWSQAVQSGLIINQPLLDSAFTSYSNERPSQHNYGLGWRILNFPNGKKITYHNGRWHGFNSFFSYLPEENVTIIVLGNKFNSRIYRTRYIYDLFGSYSNGRDDEEDENQNNDNNGSASKRSSSSSGKSALTR